MTNNYLVRLFPEEPFFFGGEKSFGNGDGQSYFVKSNYFPQQTGILGLLRYQMLKQHNKLNSIDPDLIGEHSFSADKTSQDFGKITDISPVFIQESQDLEIKNSFIPLSLDYGFDDQGEAKPILFSIESKGRVWQSALKQSIPVLQNYCAKNGLAHFLIDASGEKHKHFNYDAALKNDLINGVFIQQPRIGILKDKQSLNEEDAFYRQEYLSLDKNYSFSFFVTLEEELKDDLVWFGKEKTYFRMIVKKSEDVGFDQLFNQQTFGWKNPERSNQLILLSDAYATNGILEKSAFSINEIADFRNIQTPGKVSNYAALNYHQVPEENYRFKSDKYQLFKRGSVFWGETDKIAEELNNKNFKQIGYNKFIIF